VTAKFEPRKYNAQLIVEPVREDVSFLIG